MEPPPGGSFLTNYYAPLGDYFPELPAKRGRQNPLMTTQNKKQLIESKFLLISHAQEGQTFNKVSLFHIQKSLDMV